MLRQTNSSNNTTTKRNIIIFCSSHTLTHIHAHTQALTHERVISTKTRMVADAAKLAHTHNERLMSSRVQYKMRTRCSLIPYYTTVLPNQIELLLFTVVICVIIIIVARTINRTRLSISPAAGPTTIIIRSHTYIIYNT